MRSVLDRRVVELRAKNLTDERFTKRETMAVMNWLSIVLDKAADKYEEEGEDCFAADCREAAENLYSKLKSLRYYED